MLAARTGRSPHRPGIATSRTGTAPPPAASRPLGSAPSSDRGPPRCLRRRRLPRRPGGAAGRPRRRARARGTGHRLRVGSEDRERLHELPAERAGEVGLVEDASQPSRASAGRTRSRTNARRRSRGSSSTNLSSQPSPPRIACHTRRSVSSANPARGRGTSPPRPAPRRRRPSVVDQAVALDRRQHLHRLVHDPRAELVVVPDADEARRARVRHDDRIGCEQPELGAVALDQDRSIRSSPPLTWRTVSGTGHVVSSSSRDGRKRRCVNRPGRRRDSPRSPGSPAGRSRRPSSGGPARRSPPPGRPTGRASRCSRRRAREVPTDPVAEPLRAQPLLEHPQRRRPSRT